MTTTTTGPVALDLVLGERAATTCAQCARPMPALGRPAFELETAGGGVLCAVCSNRTHHGLRLAVATLNAALDARHAGDHQAALDTIAAIASGLELLDEATPRPARQRPVRRQPVRQSRRRR